MRFLGRAQALCRKLARRAPPEAVDALLCTALALVWRQEDAPYEAFTLVDQAVEAAKKNPATRAQASFVNACLRRFLRERDLLVKATDNDLVARWNHPRWWVERLKKEHPDQWEAILRANNTPAPMTLRANARRVTLAEYLQVLQASGISATLQAPSGVVLEHAMPVQSIPGFSDGMVSVQDGGAQLAAPLLLRGIDPKAVLNILDACAAPGGKTAHLLECSAARVTALDIDPARCDRIAQNLRRLGLTARVLTADAAEPASW
jgi:16S rRNA (cytosine967-C5)-methyltransferase